MTNILLHIENDNELCLKAKNKSFFEKSIARKLTNESWLGNIDSRSNHLFIFISLFVLPMAQEGFSRDHYHELSCDHFYGSHEGLTKTYVSV